MAGMDPTGGRADGGPAIPANLYAYHQPISPGMVDDAPALLALAQTITDEACERDHLVVTAGPRHQVISPRSPVTLDDGSAFWDPPHILVEFYADPA